ncbi:hamartin-like [Watersipora subatra]|uniref:hamartin-like n=1 Tax=Watersipora subatra TaxID=2589382 RepID=UPI00355BCF1C
MDKKGLSAAFQLLDSADLSTAKKFVENLKHYEMDTWMIESLINYYFTTQSQRAAELIAKAHDKHGKAVFRRLHSGFAEQTCRKNTLKLLLYIVSKRPPWLYKILDEAILKDVFNCMKYDVHVTLLLDSVYITIMLLPVVPDGMVKHFDEIFEYLVRLMKVSFTNKEGIPDAYILHLNAGIYSLFSRLYGMYPWHFVTRLRDYYSKQVFRHNFYIKAIEPMITNTKLNPRLITASKESELRGDQWRSKAMHDIVAECASLSLDITESTKDYEQKYPLANDSSTKMEENTACGAELRGASAPIDLAKDSLVSDSLNSTFFSPSDRLGLSTPPLGDPVTPGTVSASQFTFSQSNQGTPLLNQSSTKTPHSSVQGTPSLPTPTHHTPKNTPTTDSAGASARSRHTSGTKVSCLSRLSIDESIPPSPLRKEFTSEPPIDVPKISASAETSTVNTTSLSVSNLPHILEKISDTASSKTRDTDNSNDSEDEEVQSITQQTPDPQTAQQVAEFMKTVNRIRFISMTTADTDRDKPQKGSFKRPDSCPAFIEDMQEELHENDTKTLVESAVSNQTTSSNDLAPSKSSPVPLSTFESSEQERSAVQPIPDVYPIILPRNYDFSDQQVVGGLCTPQMADAGPGHLLDNHIKQISEHLTLGSLVHHGNQGETKQREVKTSRSGADEANIAKGELVLLYSQLLYERQKRELHAERNRRMLSKIAKAQKVKENNKTLEEQLARSRDDMFNLQTTIRLQNNEIHRMKEERARSDTSREQDLDRLIKENEQLKYANEELKREFKSKVEELDAKSQELQAAIGKYEILERDFAAVRQKNSQFVIYESEVNRMKKELLLMGEVQLKYQQRLSAIKYDNHMAVACSEQDAKFIADITKLNESLQQQVDLCQLKQNHIETLSLKIKDKDTVIQEQNKRIVTIQGEHASRLKAAEEKFTMAQSARQVLEVQIMSLYDQIGRLTVPSTPKERPSYTTLPATGSATTSSA